MPRTTDDIVAHAEELAKRFEDYEPSEKDMRDVRPFNMLRNGAAARARVEREIREAVWAAREARYSWAEIGSLLGTSGEAARTRYSIR